MLPHGKQILHYLIRCGFTSCRVCFARLLRRRRSQPSRPTAPAPRSTSVPGSGTTSEFATTQARIEDRRRTAPTVKPARSATRFRLPRLCRRQSSCCLSTNYFRLTSACPHHPGPPEPLKMPESLILPPDGRRCRAAGSVRSMSTEDDHALGFGFLRRNRKLACSGRSSCLSREQQQAAVENVSPHAVIRILCYRQDAGYVICSARLCKDPVAVVQAADASGRQVSCRSGYSAVAAIMPFPTDRKPEGIGSARLAGALPLPLLLTYT